MSKISAVSFLLVVFILSSCAKIYHSPDAARRVRNHQLIAIAPPHISIEARKKVEAEAIKEQQKTESMNFQYEMYSWLLKRKMQNRIFVDIQDVETTNAKLKKEGYFDDNPLSPNELCAILDVDGIITSNYSLSKPMSDGGAIALGVIVGVWGSTNNTTVNLEIHDYETNKLLWNYNPKISGTVGSTPAQLVDDLMRHASKKMPYSK